MSARSIKFTFHLVIPVEVFVIAHVDIDWSLFQCLMVTHVNRCGGTQIIFLEVHPTRRIGIRILIYIVLRGRIAGEHLKAKIYSCLNNDRITISMRIIA